MRLLLDTHTFLWFILDDPRLSPAARAMLIDPANELLLSPASYWEIAIKVSLGKYTVPGEFAEFMDAQVRENRLTILPIAIGDVAEVAQLPFHHRDPFDRLLVGQALVEKVPIVSTDPAFDAYGIVRMW